ncbi:hypothetical protein NHN26_10735 [Rhodovulum tesquicola]|uniref:hypothetical protein n=1 Tax=Rhodovulum tesquicola TaxID=540254 RepID=UPI002097F6C7|nr:hypothetical protein [Rhodovulum tesquicola]MCO8145702.1 hypothetical protein [Rhodovulum tesquicola]
MSINASRSILPIRAQVVPERQDLIDGLDAHLPGASSFDDDSWNVWSWGKRRHREGTTTANFAHILHAELRVAIKLMVLHKRATEKVTHTYAFPNIRVASFLGEILGARPLSKLTNADVQRCEQRLSTQYGAGCSYLTNLAMIAEYLNTWFALPVTYKRPKTAAARYGVKGTDVGRRKKLIPESVLGQLLALQTRTDLDAEDRLFVSALAINVACGFRISELMSLPVDCLVNDEDALYVRHVESKKGKAAPRLIPPQLKPVVEAAVSDLIEITNEGRNIARRWVEKKQPDWSLVLEDPAAIAYFLGEFLHEWTSDPDHRLINPDAAWHRDRGWIDVLGALRRNNGAVNATTEQLDLSWSSFNELCKQQWASRRGVLCERKKGLTVEDWQRRDRRVMSKYQFFRAIGFASGQYRKSDQMQEMIDAATRAQMRGEVYPMPPFEIELEARFGRSRPVLLADQNARPLLFVDEALMVVPKYLIGSHETKSEDFKVLEAEQFMMWLGGRPGRASVFERHGITDPRTGHPAKFVSHDIRHWLNTAYHRGGLSPEQIAILFNRQSFEGNSTYNHMTNEERREAVAGGVRDHAITGHITDTFRSIAEVNRSEAEMYLQAMTRQLNVMPHGLCAKDLAAEPCPHHLSCFSCATDDQGVGTPCAFLIVDASDDGQVKEIKRIQDNADAMLDWFEEDGMSDAPQVQHFRNIASSTRKILSEDA